MKKDREMTQVEVAEHFKVSQRTIRRWMRGVTDDGVRHQPLPHTVHATYGGVRKRVVFLLSEIEKWSGR